MLDINTITKGAVNQNSILSINVTNPESIKNQKNIQSVNFLKNPSTLNSADIMLEKYLQGNLKIFISSKVDFIPIGIIFLNFFTCSAYVIKVISLINFS